MHKHKVKKLTQLMSALKRPIAENKTLVFTNGCFDILHRGHISYLEKSKKLGDILIVGLNSDSSVRKLKGERRPIITQNDRAKLLSALTVVDFIVIYNSLTPLNLIKAIKPNVLVKGGDWEIKDIVGGKFVQSYGGVVQKLPYIKGISTKNIIEKIKSS